MKNIEKQKLENIANKHLSPTEEDRVDVFVAKSQMEFLLPYVLGDKVLELGYGFGYWTNKVIEIYKHTYIIDASKKLLDEAKNLYGDKVTCYESFFEDFDSPIKFNTIIASYILEHVEDTVLVLKKAKEWLAPNGRIIIVVPNAESLHRQLAVLMNLQESIYTLGKRDYEVGHVRVYDSQMLNNDILEAGYRIIYETGFFLKPLPFSMMTDYSDKLLQAMVEISPKLPINLMANLAFVIEPKT